MYSWTLILPAQEGQNFEWTNECQAAFVQQRKALTKVPVLFLLDLTLAFLLYTGASNVGSGAVLSQVRPEGDTMDAHYSQG